MPLGACAHRVFTRQGLYSCETTPTAFVVWPLPCIGENEARGGLAEKLDSEDVGERSRRGILETHLRVGRPEAIHGVPSLGIVVGWLIFLHFCSRLSILFV